VTVRTVAEDANFAATLSTQARARPGATAVIEPGPRRAGRASWRSITFAEMESLADRYATGLARRGVRRGDRALYLLQPSIDGYAVFYALLRLGAIPVFIDPRMGLGRLLACVETTRPRVALAVPLFRGVGLFARRSFAATEMWFTSRSLRRCVAKQRGAPSEPAAPEDVCHLPFTSGSTGPAKAVHYTHGMVRAQVGLVREVCCWREGMKVVMCFAPFVPYALADGLTVILPDMDFSRPAASRPERIVEAVNAHRSECAFASPIVWMKLARYCERACIQLPTLQRAVSAGAPVQMDLHRRLRPFLHVEGRLYTPYGSTEAMPVTTTDTLALADTWQQTSGGYGTCIGKPLPGIEVRVIRVTDEPIPRWSDELCVPSGVVGELVVGGAVVSPVYPDRADETARAKIRREGDILHRTGDLGRIDADGRVWFCGRKSQRIETRAGMLAPVAIENIFNEHPSVFRTAVVGVGPRGAQEPVACVELERGERFSPALEAELVALADATSFKGTVTRFLPHRGFPVDPRHNSKIKREELAAWAAGKVRASP
jgi:olefin beta-lactone synthetase